jgi:ribonuclease D
MFDKIQPYLGIETVAIDVETTGLRHYADEIFGVSVTVKDQGEYVTQYEDVREHDSRIWDFLTDLAVQAERVVNHNIGFDLRMLWSSGVLIDAAKCICSQVRANLIDEHLPRYTLDALSKRYLKAEKVAEIYEQLAEMFGGPATRKVQIKNLQHAPPEMARPYAEKDTELPPEMARPYAEKDTELAYKLWEWQEEEIERQDLHQIDDLERRAFVPINDMTYRGIRVDIDRAERRWKSGSRP